MYIVSPTIPWHCGIMNNNLFSWLIEKVVFNIYTEIKNDVVNCFGQPNMGYMATQIM